MVREVTLPCVTTKYRSAFSALPLHRLRRALRCRQLPIKASSCLAHTSGTRFHLYLDDSPPFMSLWLIPLALALNASSRQRPRAWMSSGDPGERSQNLRYVHAHATSANTTARAVYTNVLSTPRSMIAAGPRLCSRAAARAVRRASQACGRDGSRGPCECGRSRSCTCQVPRVYY